MSSNEPKRNIPVLLGSRRVGRRSERVAQFLVNGLSAREGIDTDLIDLAVVDLPILRERTEEAENPPPSFPSFRERIAAADGLVIVSPEYKGGYPGVLKNAARPSRSRNLPPQADRHRHCFLGRVRRPELLGELRLVCLPWAACRSPWCSRSPRSTRRSTKPVTRLIRGWKAAAPNSWMSCSGTPGHRECTDAQARPRVLKTNAPLVTHL